MASAREELATRYRDDVPPYVEPDVWAGACALAVRRHPIAIYPQPMDVEYARIVLAAVKAAVGGADGALL